MIRFDEKEMREFLKEACDDAGGQGPWARLHGFSSQFVCDVLKERRNVTENLAKALGYKQVIEFERAGRRS